MNKLVICIIVFTFSYLGFSQNEPQNTYTISKKGNLFFSWGGNRGYFSKSDIHFKGEDYDFTIYKAEAKDKAKGWHIDYFNPKRITIPQTNAKIGYFIKEHYTVSVGLDHLKYVMKPNLYKQVNGYIDLPKSDEGSQYNGIYNDENVLISEDFLQFEHTDGLNYIYAEFARFDDISKLFKINNINKLQINVTEGIASGILLPKTNTTLLGKERHDEFHLSGYGISIHAGLNFTFYKHFFMQIDFKGGYINMPDIRTTKLTVDKASQHFLYFENVVNFGGIFNI